MPRQLRVEYPGAIYHVMSRGNGCQNIFYDDVDRQDFLKTLAEACQKTGWQVHAYCLMGNHFHLVVETPNGNLVAGMRWFLSSYTLRLNRRHQRFGHVFSGRYKALIVEGSGNGYLKTVCDYVHLNPVRARLLGKADRLLGYPWSSFSWYLAVPAHRPAWLRVERLLGEHGISGDTPAGRQTFEQRMEARRAAKTDGSEWAKVRRGWCLGSEDFRQGLLERMEGKLGDHHAGGLHQETAEAKAERIIREEMTRQGWKEKELKERTKSDPVKLALAARLRQETTLTIRAIAGRLDMGTWKSAKTRLQSRKAKEKDDANISVF